MDNSWHEGVLSSVQREAQEVAACVEEHRRVGGDMTRREAFEKVCADCRLDIKCSYCPVWATDKECSHTTHDAVPEVAVAASAMSFVVWAIERLFPE
jgi:hypothetical protein